jgi:hypothetical protein
MPNGSSGQKATCARRQRVCLPSTVDIGRQFSQVGFRPDADLLPFLGLEITRPVEIGALRPIFGSPEGRVFRLGHDGGLAAPSWFNNIIGGFWPIAP